MPNNNAARLLLLALLGLAACAEDVTTAKGQHTRLPRWEMGRYIDSTLMVACYKWPTVDGVSCVRIDHLPPAEKP